MKPPLKLYVWEGVLCDYYPGLAVAIAPDLRAAKAAVRKSYGIPSDRLEADLRTVKPKVIRLDKDPDPQAWTVSGGG